MTLSRRGFLGACLLAATAPAIVRPSSLMKIIVPSSQLILPGTWEYYAATGESVSEFLRQQIAEKVDGGRGGVIRIPTGRYNISEPIHLVGGIVLFGNNATFVQDRELPYHLIVDSNAKGARAQDIHIESFTRS